MQPYEERYLFLLLLLRQPRARLIYVTSQPILPSVVDYYLDLLPGVIPSHARPRLFTVPVLDGTDEAAVGEAARAAAPHGAHPRADPRSDRARTSCPTTRPSSSATSRCASASRCTAPTRATSRSAPRAAAGGCSTRKACRYPLGVENLATIDDVVDAIVDVRARKPEVAQVLVKLNEGVSGEGNALVDLAGVPEPVTASDARDAIRKAVEAMQFELENAHLRRLRRQARRARRRDRGAHPGHRLPQPERAAARDAARRARAALDPRPAARRRERPVVPRAASSRPTRSTRRRSRARRRRSGKRLAAEGVIGRFALDFVTVRNDAGEWDTYAIEINLRKGGTTHPFLTLQFLTDGTYDPETRHVHRAVGQGEVLRGQRPRRVTRRTAASRPTTCSTSSCATASTSTSRARPASSST